MVIGFIGLGNMAKAMIGGILKNGIVGSADVIGSAATQETIDKVREQYEIEVTLSNKEVARKADVIILAVKPIVLPVVLEEIMDETDESKLIISIAAGKTTKWISQYFNKPVKIVRCMPNTPALVQEGASAVCRNENVSDEDLEIALSIVRSFGMAEVVNENLVDVIGAVSGASPAYVFMFIEALADAGVKWGLSRKQAYRFCAQAVMGSAKLMLESGRHPAELKDMVCSPGGTTIEGLEVLERTGMRGDIMEAIDACMNKTKQM
ncbi:pyrroline-5-carboxylate reductase [Lachnospiraceae bacterium NK3A20]|jgi:pyrroline-5-carboxylate reductase|nr:pyrroline-5-carboxylate reductase [Lachnospiraceae bacterium NK3A20]